MAPSTRPPEICLVSREVFPLIGGGIGSYVTALAALLRDLGSVRVITTTLWEPLFRELQAAGDDRLPEGLRWTFVPEPDMDETGDWFGFHHLWSARAFDAIVEQYGRHGPDLVEFPDYHGEGFVTAQAKRTGHRTLTNTRVAVRAHTSWEMCRVLDGWVGTGREETSIAVLERATLRMADVLLWAGGDILGTYQRYYGANALAPNLRVRHPLSFAPPQPHDDQRWEVGYPLRFIYIGRLERRKGVQDMVRALMSNDSDAWSLTMVGADTDTAPFGASQRAQLELMTMGDERFCFADAVPRDQLMDLLRHNHVLMMLSRWECWPTVVLESLAMNRPVLATPTGGMLEMVQPGAGWLTRSPDAPAIRAQIDELVADLKAVEELIQSHGPRSAAAGLARDTDVRDAYAELVGRPALPPRAHRRRHPVAAAAPLVSVIVPYFQLGDFLPDTLRSIAAQTYGPIEVIVVNDGSRSSRDASALAEAEVQGSVRVFTQPNRGLGPARNTGILQSRGRYVLPLDADNVIAPTFVARCVELLESDPSIAYVTTWSRYIDEDGEALSWPESRAPRGYHPIGNDTAWVERLNTAGDAVALFPRRLFDLGFRYSSDVPIIEDWTLYRALHRAGRHGVVIPERLVSYRVRPDSMYQTTHAGSLVRVREEATAQLDEEAIAWTP